MAMPGSLNIHTREQDECQREILMFQSGFESQVCLSCVWACATTVTAARHALSLAPFSCLAQSPTPMFLLEIFIIKINLKLI
jgi:hypothetical protein